MFGSGIIRLSGQVLTHLSGLLLQAWTHKSQLSRVADTSEIVSVSEMRFFVRGELLPQYPCQLFHSVVGVLPLIGVWTAETIPVRTCFGPLIGQQSHSMEVAEWTDKAVNHIWKVSVEGTSLTFGCCCNPRWLQSLSPPLQLPKCWNYPCHCQA